MFKSSKSEDIFFDMFIKTAELLESCTALDELVIKLC
jgi:hypothetical protein